MLLNSQKLYPMTTGEPIDPAGNPSPPDHWDLVPDIVVQAPALFGGHRGPFQMAPFERPHVLWHQDGHWRIDPYGIGHRGDPDFDYGRTTFVVTDGQVIQDLEPGQVHLLRHARFANGRCGVELELLEA
jgi:hypothetical protein